MADPRLLELDAFTTNEALFEAGVRHGTFLERAKSGARNRLHADLNAPIGELRSTLERGLIRNRLRGQTITVRSTKGLRQLSERAAGQLDGMLKEAASSIRSDALRLAKSEADFALKSLRQAVPRGVKLRAAKASVIRSRVLATEMQGARISEWARGLRSGLKRDLLRALNQGLSEGLDAEAIVRRVLGSSRRAGGLTLRIRRQVEALVRTAYTHASMAAREEVFLANADLVKAVQWVAVLDSRTTVICRSRDGRTWPAGEGPRPPAHFRCRSVVVAVTRSWREAGMRGLSPVARSKLTGERVDVPTYTQWLRSQPAAVQNEILGEKKARLFRGRKVTIDQFVDQRGRELTLDQLEERASG